MLDGIGQPSQRLGSFQAPCLFPLGMLCALRPGLPTNLLDHLHDGANSRRWLVKLDVVAALVGNQLLAMR